MKYCLLHVTSCNSFGNQVVNVTRHNVLFINGDQVVLESGHTIPLSKIVREKCVYTSSKDILMLVEVGESVDQTLLKKERILKLADERKSHMDRVASIDNEIRELYESIKGGVQSV